MDPEKRIVCVKEKLVIEFDILLGRDLRGLFCPERHCVVYGLVVMAALAVASLALGVLVLVLDTVVEIDRHGHERAIAVKHRAQPRCLEVFLFVLGYVHYDLGAARFAVALGYLVFTRFVAAPVDGRSAGIGERVDLYRVADHERGVKAETEVTDDTV